MILKYVGVFWALLEDQDTVQRLVLLSDDLIRFPPRLSSSHFFNNTSKSFVTNTYERRNAQKR
jgi:hypothetical protein